MHHEGSHVRRPERPVPDDGNRLEDVAPVPGGPLPPDHGREDRDPGLSLAGSLHLGLRTLAAHLDFKSGPECRGLIVVFPGFGKNPHGGRL